MHLLNLVSDFLFLISLLLLLSSPSLYGDEPLRLGPSRLGGEADQWSSDCSSSSSPDHHRCRIETICDAEIERSKALALFSFSLPSYLPARLLSPPVIEQEFWVGRL